MTYQEAKSAFEAIFSGTMEAEEAKSLLIAMYEAGESADEIRAAVEVMRSHSLKLPVPAELEGKLIDNCGTGGDKSGSYNVSTTVSILVASIGCYVAKHGNRSITSKSGSADMLEALGINLGLSPEQQATMLGETGFAFLFAQQYHPAMKHVMPIRKSIPHRTLFNLLGPMTNPADVTRQFIGVYDGDYTQRVAEVLRDTGSVRAMVAHGMDGLDEISIGAVSRISELKNGEVTTYELDPQAYGIKRADLDEISGGNAQENAFITKSLLSGRTTGPKRDILLLNAAASLMVDDKARDMKEGLEMAADAIDSGKAEAKLNQIIQVSAKL